MILKEIEKEINSAERSSFHLYGELNRILHESIEDRIRRELNRGFELKKSQMLQPLFSISFFEDIRKEIYDILNPLKIIIGNQDETILDKLEELGLESPELNMFSIYRKAYNISHMISEHIQKPKHSYSWRKQALKWMEKNTANHIDSHILSYTNSVIDNIKTTTDTYEKEIYSVIEHYDKTRQTTKELMINAVEKRKPLSQVKTKLKDVTRDYYRNWQLVVETEFAMAKNMGTTQAIEDIATTLGENPTVSIVDMNDDRVSEFCEKHSRDKNNNLKYYKFYDLKPAGYNLGLNKKDWKNSIPPRHFRCRCWMVYVPKGFKLNKQGSLQPLKDGETIEIVNN